MERLSSLLERVNSRTGATLAVLWSLQFPRVRAYLARVLLAGGAAGLVLLNFGLDMEGRARRRQLVPGVSRLLVCCVLLSLWRSRLKARLFLMGCACRLLPPCHHVAVSSLYALLCRLRGSPFSLLPAGGGPRRFDDTCSICLEEPSDYAADCGHSFHRNCLERWVKVICIWEFSLFSLLNCGSGRRTVRCASERWRRARTCWRTCCSSASPNGRAITQHSAVSIGRVLSSDPLSPLLLPLCKRGQQLVQCLEHMRQMALLHVVVVCLWVLDILPQHSLGQQLRHSPPVFHVNDAVMRPVKYDSGTFEERNLGARHEYVGAGQREEARKDDSHSTQQRRLQHQTVG